MSRSVVIVSVRSCASADGSASSRANGPAPVAASASAHGTCAARRFEVGGRVLSRWTGEPQSRATAAQRGKQPRGLAGDEQHQRARRRFLESLEQRIGCKVVHRFGRSDDRDLVATTMRGQREFGRQIAHLADEDLRGILFGRQSLDVRMLIRSDPAALLALAARCACRYAAIHSLCDPARELESAGAWVFVDQQTMRKTPGA